MNVGMKGGPEYIRGCMLQEEMTHKKLVVQ